MVVQPLGSQDSSTQSDSLLIAVLDVQNQTLTFIDPNSEINQLDQLIDRPEVHFTQLY